MAQTPNVYQTNIPMVPVVPGSHLPARGRGILQGAVINDDDLVHAEQDIRLRKSLLRDGVTPVQVEQANKRKFAIMMDHVMAEYQSGVPAWFNTAVTQLRQDMNQLRQDVTQEVAQLRQDVNAVLNSAVESVNANNQRRNYKIMTQPNNAHIPLFPYRNSNQALGGPLPGRPVPAVPPVLPAVGATIPTPPFPRDIHDADSFTMDQIEALSMVLNNDFGIIAQDSLVECRSKMKDYLFLTMR
jgi:hypothetical protein